MTVGVIDLTVCNDFRLTSWKLLVLPCFAEFVYGTKAGSLSHLKGDIVLAAVSNSAVFPGEIRIAGRKLEILDIPCLYVSPYLRTTNYWRTWGWPMRLKRCRRIKRLFWRLFDMKVLCCNTAQAGHRLPMKTTNIWINILSLGLLQGNLKSDAEVVLTAVKHNGLLDFRVFPDLSRFNDILRWEKPRLCNRLCRWKTTFLPRGWFFSSFGRSSEASIVCRWCWKPSEIADLSCSGLVWKLKKERLWDTLRQRNL